MVPILSYPSSTLSEEAPEPVGDNLVPPTGRWWELLGFMAETPAGIAVTALPPHAS